MMYELERGSEVYDLDLEVKCTYRGYPGSGPSFSSPGEPPEAPEFEIEAFIEAPAWAKYPHNSIPFATTQAEDEAIYDFVYQNWDWAGDDDNYGDY